MRIYKPTKPNLANKLVNIGTDVYAIEEDGPWAVVCDGERVAVASNDVRVKMSLAEALALVSLLEDHMETYADAVRTYAEANRKSIGLRDVAKWSMPETVEPIRIGGAE